MDHNIVGTYQCTYLGTFIADVFEDVDKRGGEAERRHKETLIERQYAFQKASASSVMVLFDPVVSRTGKLALTALRLTPEAMKACGADAGAAATLAALPSSNIFTVLPVKIHNHDLLQALLLDMDKQMGAAGSFDTLELVSHSFLEKNLGFLIENVQYLVLSSSHLRRWERALSDQRKEQEQWLAKRKEENARRKELGQSALPEEPDSGVAAFKAPTEHVRRGKLRQLLIFAQSGTQCSQIDKYSGQSIGKLFLAGGMQ